MSARVYFMKRVKDSKDVSIMSPQDEQCEDGQVYSVFILYFLVLLCTTVYAVKHKQTNCKHSRRKSYGLQLSQ